MLGRRNFRLFVLATIVIATAGCGSPAQQQTELASGKPLPSACPPGNARGTETVTFVASGHVWALDSESERLTCLFRVDRAGPLAWGPRGDRLLLGQLEVKSLGTAPSRPPGTVDPRLASWGRPIGKSIVFVGRHGHALLKAHPAGGGFLDVTPLRHVVYKRVVYHPSGLAFGFVVKRHGRESIWISSNLGKKPKQLVHGRFHTGFETIAFGDRGQAIYFAALHRDHHVDVHKLPLVGANSAPVVWHGQPGEHVFDILPLDPVKQPVRFAITVGRSCATERAIVVSPGHPKGVDALPGVRPARAVGWIDDTKRAKLLVSTGGCGSPIDLYAVDSVSLHSKLLVENVDAASTRLAEPYPPPGLPKATGARSSFA
jgi:hypothetical protein